MPIFYQKFLRKHINLDPLGVEQNSDHTAYFCTLSLIPIENPWQYIKELQSTFDYRKIKYTEDFYDPDMNGIIECTLPKWEVYFDGNFWGHRGKQRPGKEITVQTHFQLNNKEWYIPAIYSCSNGLVIDFCVKIPAEHIANFINKWKLSPENDGSDFSEEQQEEIEAENPMAVSINSEIVLNGKTIPCSHGCGLSWNPCFPEQNGIESDGACKYYGLDQDSGWVIWRATFPWQTKRKPSITSLGVTIKHYPIDICDSHFNTNTPDESIEFTNPITNKLHTLTIQKYEKQEISANSISDDDYDFPSHCIAMSYTISPDLDEESFSVRDCNDGDRPRKKHCNSMKPQATGGCCAVGIIGAACSAANSNGQGKLRAVCSALHFEPVETVDWKIIFHEKPCEDMTVKLI